VRFHTDAHGLRRGDHYTALTKTEEIDVIDARIPAGALVLVGDGRCARFLRNKGTPRHVEFLVERVLEIENPPTRDQGSDRPGRYMGSDGANRSAVEQTDWHEVAEERFAIEIADTLHRMSQARKYDNLVVIAPPRMLGSLRAAFHPQVSARVVAEVAKDLTSRSVPELETLLC
jgi:protein required for attachment to host cells